MADNNWVQKLNVPAQCRKYGLSLWQCPQFLFVIMGLIIITASLTSYGIGTRYITEPRLVALIVIGLAIILLIIASAISRSVEKLAEINRMKSEFVSVVSHQLRAPLSNLRWAIELLMSGRLGTIEEKQVEYFKIVKENSSRMRELISDLVTVSRIETATLSPRKETLSLANLISKTINSFKIFARASNVKITFNAQERLSDVLADSSQIKMVVANLLDNAIRYIKDKGEVTVDLSKKGKFLVCKVRDNGVGVPIEDQKHIFEKFFRSDNVLKQQTQGSGLGLYIAKAVINKSGGKIGFESKENKGSTFWFTLPIKK